MAADYRLWTPRPEEMYRSNVDGTRNRFEAARRGGVERFVYTSTVGCIGMRKGELGSEDTPAGLDEMQGPYKRSKYLAEQVALQFAQEGFPVVIVNQTAPVGDPISAHADGKVIVDFARGHAGVCRYRTERGGCERCRARAPAACERTRGERYILGGENMTLEQILVQLAEVTGKVAPKLRIPYAVPTRRESLHGLGGDDG